MLYSITHYIETNGPPIHNKARCLAPAKLKATKAEFKQMMKVGVIHPSESKWFSPLHLVSKSPNTWHAYRILNSITKPDRYSVHYILDITAVAQNNKYFMKLNLIWDHPQLPVELNHILKTAITTVFGMYKIVQVSFGLCNATQTFQRLIDWVLFDLLLVYAYRNDVVIASENMQDHIWHIKHISIQQDEI